MESPPNIYVYKLTTDNGGAPCVQNNLLSLSICKPRIRKKATEGSLIFGFGGKNFGERLIYVAYVTNKLKPGEYYRDDKYSKRRDCIYQEIEGKAELKSDARFHTTGGELSTDVGKHFEHSYVLLSEDFRYLGGEGSADYKRDFPAIKVLIENLRRGHRVNHTPDLFEELLRLKSCVWSKWPANTSKRPSENDFTKICNGDDGSCGVTRTKTESLDNDS